MENVKLRSLIREEIRRSKRLLTEQANSVEGWTIKQVSDKEFLATGRIGRLQIEAKVVEVDGYKVGRKRIKPEIHVEAVLIHGSERILFFREEFENNRPGRPLVDKDFGWLLDGALWTIVSPIISAGNIQTPSYIMTPAGRVRASTSEKS